MITKAVGSRWKRVVFNLASQRSIGSATSRSECSTAAMLVIMIIIIIYTSQGSLDKLAKQFNDECEITKPKPHFKSSGSDLDDHDVNFKVSIFEILYEVRPIFCLFKGNLYSLHKMFSSSSSSSS